MVGSEDEPGGLEGVGQTIRFRYYLSRYLPRRFGSFTAPATFSKNVCTSASSYTLFCTFNEVRAHTAVDPICGQLAAEGIGQ